MTANAAAKTIVSWVGVLGLGYLVWRLFGLPHPVISHGLFGGVALLGCVVLAFIYFKTALYFAYWLFVVRKPEFGK